jgi:hypothetical protein
MQSQQRAENGIKEIIIGYYGHESETSSAPESTVQDAIGAFNEAGAGPVHAVNAEDLPEEIREVYLAEQHRLRTGKFLKASEFRTRKDES